MTKISDEIREFVKRSYADEYMDPRELLAIADRIDAEHEQVVGFCKRLEGAAANREDVEIFGVEYTALPLDADGVPIHVGDTVWDLGDDGEETCVKSITLYPNGVASIAIVGESCVIPTELTHARPDSWERIANELEAWCDDADVDVDACEKPRDLAKRIRRLAEKEDKHERE